MKYRYKNLFYFFLSVCLALPAGCCFLPKRMPKNFVVLLKNPDGTTGAITVTNKKATRELDSAGFAVGMDDTSKPPGEPFIFEEEKIEKVFGKAIQAKPEAPISFILYFKLDKTELSDEYKKVIQRIPPAISARKFPSIGIIGHCDRSGSKEYNQQLAMKRAEAVRDFLVKTGIDPEAISVTSHGENNPLVETPDGVYELRNRRVEVYVR